MISLVFLFSARPPLRPVGDGGRGRREMGREIDEAEDRHHNDARDHRGYEAPITVELLGRLRGAVVLGAGSTLSPRLLLGPQPVQPPPELSASHVVVSSEPFASLGRVSALESLD